MRKPRALAQYRMEPRRSRSRGPYDEKGRKFVKRTISVRRRCCSRAVLGHATPSGGILAGGNSTASLLLASPSRACIRVAQSGCATRGRGCPEGNVLVLKMSKDSPPSAVSKAKPKPSGSATSASAQQLGCILRIIGENHARPRAPDAEQRLHHDALPLDPSVPRRSLDHRILA
jgi:hypothetical protein